MEYINLIDLYIFKLCSSDNTDTLQRTVCSDAVILSPCTRYAKYFITTILILVIILITIIIIIIVPQP